MQDPEPSSPEAIRKLREELVRLRLKYQQSTDRDIRSVLQLRITQIEEQLPPEALQEPTEPLETEPALEEPEADLPPATREQLEEADKFVRQARVEKMRGNPAKSTELLKQAAAAAPGSASVLEALGDDLAERKQLKAAMDAYRRAFKLDASNVGVEEKLANIALTMGSMGSIEDQMRRNLSDSPFLNEADAVARMPAAVMLSALLPGTGHIVLGRAGQGFAILGAWVISLIWMLSHWFDLVKLISLSSGGREKPDMIVLAPLLLMAVIYVSTLGSLKGMSGQVGRRKPIDRPRPPVDLPFD